MGAGLGREYAARVCAIADEYKSASVAAVSREWTAFEHGRICEGLWLQEGRRRGAGESLQDLVRRQKPEEKLPGWVAQLGSVGLQLTRTSKAARAAASRGASLAFLLFARPSREVTPASGISDELRDVPQTNLGNLENISRGG